MPGGAFLYVLEEKTLEDAKKIRNVWFDFKRSLQSEGRDSLSLEAMDGPPPLPSNPSQCGLVPCTAAGELSRTPVSAEPRFDDIWRSEVSVARRVRSQRGEE
jgi:hypothetical protein